MEPRTRNIFFWEYYLYTWLPWREMPVFYPHLISQDLRTLRDFGKGEFIESESWGSNGGVPESMRGHICFPGTQHLNLYVTAKALWNSRMDVDNLLDEYYTQFYGTAGVEMRTFWTTAETLWMSEKAVAGGIGSGDNPTDRYKSSDIANLCKLLSDGLAKVEDGSVFARRIRLVQTEVRHEFKRINNLLDRKRSEYTMPKVGGSIALGGLVDKFPWNRMDAVSFAGKTGEAAPYSTLAFGVWSSTDLYLTVRQFRAGDEPSPGESHGEGRNTFEDDSVEAFLCPDPKKPAHCYHFIISASGALWDGETKGDPESADSKWNSGTEVKTFRENNRWIAQIRIPLQDLGRSARRSGSRWRPISTATDTAGNRSPIWLGHPRSSRAILPQGFRPVALWPRHPKREITGAGHDVKRIRRPAILEQESRFSVTCWVPWPCKRGHGTRYASCRCAQISVHAPGIGAG